MDLVHFALLASSWMLAAVWAGIFVIFFNYLRLSLRRDPVITSLLAMLLLNAFGAFSENLHRGAIAAISDRPLPADLLSDFTNHWMSAAVAASIILLLLRHRLAAGIEEKHRQELALARSETRFRDFAEAASDWFWETDADHRYVWFSDKFANREDADPVPLLGRSRLDLARIEDDPEGWTRHQEILERRLPYKDFTFLAHNTQRTRWVRSSGVPIFDEGGAFIGYRGTGKDVTAEISASRRAEEARGELIQTIDQVPVGIAVFDVADRLLYHNRTYAEMNHPFRDRIVGGISFEEICRLLVDAGCVVPETSAEAWIEGRRAHHAAGGCSRLRHGSRILDVRDHALPDGRSVMVLTDVTEREAAEWRALEATERLAAAIRALDDTFILLDAQSRVVTCNDAFKRAHQPLAHLLEPGASFANIVRQAVAAGYGAAADELLAPLLGGDADELGEQGSHEVERGDGTFALVRAQRMPDGGTILIGRDITVRKEAEAALAAAMAETEAASKAKSAFIANMSHELRTPLNAIIGFSEMILEEVHGPLGVPKYLEYLGDIHISAEHLVELIADILDMSKIESGALQLELEQNDLTCVFDRVLPMVASAAASAGITLELAGDVEGPPLVADARSLRQTVLNLLSNAIKFTPPGGRIVVGVRREQAHVAISVEDTGVGIAPKDLARLTKPFVQVGNGHQRREGTGLGLALSRALVELHGGRLLLESVEGEGTRATLVFPSTLAPSTVLPSPAADTPVPHIGRH